MATLVLYVSLTIYKWADYNTMLLYLFCQCTSGESGYESSESRVDGELKGAGISLAKTSNVENQTTLTEKH